MNELVQKNTPSITGTMASKFNMSIEAFEATIRDTCMNPGKSGRVATKTEFAAFLMVANEYNLNPLTKEIYAFPGKNGGIQPIVSIDGWMNLINSHPNFDGMEFEDILSNGSVIAIKCRIFRKDRSRPIEVIEYLSECKRNTEPWNGWPTRMLRHKAAIQCARYAFGFAGIIDQDEYDRQYEGKVEFNVSKKPPIPPKIQITSQVTGGLNASDNPTTSKAVEAFASKKEDSESPQNGEVSNPPQETVEQQQSTNTTSEIQAEVQGSEPNLSDHSIDPVDLANARGREAARKGMSRKATPPEYRDESRSQELEAWL